MSHHLRSPTIKTPTSRPATPIRCRTPGTRSESRGPPSPHHPNTKSPDRDESQRAQHQSAHGSHGDGRPQPLRHAGAHHHEEQREDHVRDRQAVPRRVAPPPEQLERPARFSTSTSPATANPRTASREVNRTRSGVAGSPGASSATTVVMRSTRPSSAAASRWSAGELLDLLERLIRPGGDVELVLAGEHDEQLDVTPRKAGAGHVADAIDRLELNACESVLLQVDDVSLEVRARPGNELRTHRHAVLRDATGVVVCAHREDRVAIPPSCL